MSQGYAGPQAMEGKSFAIRTERRLGDEHVSLLGELDLSVIGSVDREMQRAEATDATRIVLDLRELDFLDASGIRLLLHLGRRSRNNGCRLRIAGARAPQVRRVIDLTGAADVLPFLD